MLVSSSLEGRWFGSNSGNVIDSSSISDGEVMLVIGAIPEGAAKPSYLGFSNALLTFDKQDLVKNDIQAAFRLIQAISSAHRLEGLGDVLDMSRENLEEIADLRESLRKAFPEINKTLKLVVKVVGKPEILSSIVYTPNPIRHDHF
jgi:hypothetical protein